MSNKYETSSCLHWHPSLMFICRCRHDDEWWQQATCGSAEKWDVKKTPRIYRSDCADSGCIARDQIWISFRTTYYMKVAQITWRQKKKILSGLLTSSIHIIKTNQLHNYLCFSCYDMSAILNTSHHSIFYYWRRHSTFMVICAVHLSKTWTNSSS